MSPVALSLVIPSFNEAARLPQYLDTVRRYFAAIFPNQYEVIVVDDGSRDGVLARLKQDYHDWPELSVLSHTINMGKGAAIRTGMMAARGELRLFTDADGATPIEEERVLRAAIESGAQVAIGSRARLPGGAGQTNRWWYRELVGRCFALLVRRLLPLPIRDSQCGFKVFTRMAAEAIFSRSRECGFLIDVELLMIAQQLNFRVAEIPVRWRDVPGSKVRLTRDGWRMLWGIWALRRRMRIGPPDWGHTDVACCDPRSADQ